MRPPARGALACALAALALLAASGCGGGDEPAVASKPAGDGGGGAAIARASGGDPAPEARAGRCGSGLHRFVGALGGLRSELAVGANYDEYLAAVKRLRRAYDDVPVGEESAVCVVAVGAPAERALNQYVEGVNAWGDCVAVADCDLGPVESELQRRWARAGELVTAAQRGLRPDDRR